MPEDILVVEYEPRYTERVRQALTGQPFSPRFAKDGEEALQALNAARPRLIVVSGMLPRISTPDLVRTIRGRSEHQKTPILVTVSGYNGKSPKADAVRYGADDLLPKPYSEAEFLSKVRQLLAGVESSAASAHPVADGSSDWTPVKPPVPRSDEKSHPVTSNELFGGVLNEEKPAPKKTTTQAEDLDKMLADTLSGVRTAAKRKTMETPLPNEAQQAAKAAKAKSDLDQLLHDTLSGLEKTGKKSTADSIPVPKPVVKSEPKPVPPPPPPVEDDIQIASPVVLPKKEEPKDEELDEAGVTRFGQYNLLEKIAVGGMAEVWKARMRGVEGFQKTVAIKKILPHLSDNEEFVTMFVDEAKLAAQLNHNNIIHIYDLGKIASSYYIAMEYIDGADLKTILKRGEERGHPMTIEIALFVASKIASALDYAHRKRDFHEKELGLVHRDVSPQNVLISHEGDIKLCDFGIAKAASKASHTQAGALKGKLQYMSPEQAWGRPIDRRADIFALATVLFEMLTERKLFVGDNEMSILEQVREARVAPPSQFNDEITPEIDAIVRKALQKEPDNRYQTAGELAKDLDTILYNFRPTPTSADLAIFMHRLFREEPIAPGAHHAPIRIEEAHATVADDEIIPPPRPVAPTPAPVSHAAPLAPAPAIHHPTRTDEHARSLIAEKKKFPVVPVAATVIVLLGIAAGAVVIMKGKKPAATTASAATKTSAAPANVQTAPPTDGAAIVTDTATTSTPMAAVETAGTIPIDQALVDQEVRKRLEAERTRLEQQRQEQLAAAERAREARSQPEESPTAAASAPAPAPAPQTQTAAPPPQTATVAEARPEPPPAQTATPVAERPVREGDLVETGTPGLIAPELLNFRKPAYPPIAKMRRVEGVVVLSVLVSETGRPMDVKVLRGVKENVGINEAAVEALRNATFRPATKDGVRVKTYKTVTIPFEL